MKQQTQQKYAPSLTEPLKDQPPRKKLQIIAVSDTHGSNKVIQQALSSMTYNQMGDIFIHAGDFTKRGSQESFVNFFNLLDKIKTKFKYVIVIAGNHQIMMDNGAWSMDQNKRQKCLEKYPCSMSKAQIIAQLKKRCIYLQHEAFQLQGIKIFGSPYTLQYCNTAFQYHPKMDQVVWSKVPKQVDILITHCPPYGILDTSKSTKCKDPHGGSKALKIVSMDRKPKLHIFGHIHQGQGVNKIGDTMYVNVAKQPTRLLI